MSKIKSIDKQRETTDAIRPYAIQGYEGSFHEEAAQKFFGHPVPVYPCDNFRDLIKVAADKTITNGGVMAIENSIAGSILPNYNLLHQSFLTVTGEIYLEIRQQLLVNSGVELGHVREVHSHTMALQQCLDYLDKHKWKLVETEDTALSAKKLAQQKSRTIAVIASRLAARKYGLQIVAPNIHTQKNNYTRFLILNRLADVKPVDNADKASIMFTTDHSQGSLAKVLSIIAANAINLSKLQSFPIPGSDFQYAFHADLEFDRFDDFNRAWKQILPITKSLKLYGIYKRGLWK